MVCVLSGCGSAAPVSTDSTAGSKTRAVESESKSKAYSELDTVSDSETQMADSSSSVSSATSISEDNHDDTNENEVENTVSASSDPNGNPDASSSTEISEDDGSLSSAMQYYTGMQGTGIGDLVIEDAEVSEMEAALYAQEDGMEESARLYKITANQNLKDFSLAHVSYDENGNLIDTDIFYEVPDIAGGQYILLSEIIPEGMPSVCVQWSDDFGEAYQRYIAESGLDGRLLLIQMGEDGFSEAKIDEDSLQAALASCVGWGGDAGSSLKGTSAAAQLYVWCADNSSLVINTQAVLQKFWEEADAQTRDNFASNWTGNIRETGDLISSREEGITGLLTDCGVLDPVITAWEANAVDENWEMLKEAIDRLIES